MTIKELHNIFLSYPKISKDSREPNIKDSLFFALKGENHDANCYAKSALESGCRYAVIDNPAFKVNERYILVEDVLKTLQELANYHRNYCKAKILAITGTNGKTTTKELIATVLATTYNTTFTQGNYNNHIGMPLSLLQIKEDTDIAVIEMGASGLNEIAELCAIAEPDYGIITNVGEGHLEGFGSLEGVIKTKTELYESVAQKNGTLFVNADNEILSKKALQYACPIYSYGTKDAQTQGTFISASPYLIANIEDTEVTPELIGDYNFENILAAYAIGQFFGVKKGDIVSAINGFVPTENRSQLIQKKTNTLVMDAYNANFLSMTKSILNFTQMDYPDKMLILGDMFELGNFAEEAHQKIKALLKANNLDKHTILTGANFTKERTGGFHYIPTTEEVVAYIKENPITDKLILIKGSRGVKLEVLQDIL